MTVKMLAGYTELLPYTCHSAGSDKPAHRDRGKGWTSRNWLTVRDHGTAFELNLLEIDVHPESAAFRLAKFTAYQKLCSGNPRFDYCFWRYKLDIAPINGAFL